ncbi:hydroxyacylglutathione hydrolase [Teredinibacter purpureus]|uniref:hydroxyacylglutathione hydrolase n=1 Tax=Teredinibacter purpureus TaxID=2731756 RepID=UPI0005F78276|nr:hydroxyacylglutathione hydrolase [Teredinibacter purpureus]
MIEIKAIPILQDNYVWALLPKNSNDAIIIDPGLAEPVTQFLQENNRKLTAILVTHHHWDHTDGIKTLVDAAQCPVYGPDSHAIPQVTHPLISGATISPCANGQLAVIAIPGHTEEHIGYQLLHQEQPILFCGDTLFSAGCGRLLGGTAEQLKHSLDMIKELPSSTLIYPTHEYTQANLTFAKAVMPNNRSVKDYTRWVAQQRNKHAITLPTTVARELALNPFMRCNDQEVVDAVKGHFSIDASDEQTIFTHLRLWKDHF